MTPSGQRLAAIYNPQSGGGGYRRDMPLIFDALRGLGYEVAELQTQEPGDASRLAREAVVEGFDLVAAVGGDGTVNETINGLAGSDMPLAIIPTGTVNVLAMELGIPLEPPTPSAFSQQGTVSWIDLGLAGDRYFGLMAGWGWTPPSSPRSTPCSRRRSRRRPSRSRALPRTSPMKTRSSGYVAGAHVEGYFAVFGNSSNYGGGSASPHSPTCATGCSTYACSRTSRSSAPSGTGRRRSSMRTSSTPRWSTSTPRALAS